MAKQGKKSTRKGTKVRRQPATRRMAQPRSRAISSVPRSPRLDTAASDYARLIVDPCNAKLTNTIWPGSEGALVSRFESDFIVYSGAVAGTFAFCPGSGGFYYNLTNMAADTTLSAFTPAAAALCPGMTFLVGQASSIRSVAACLQITYPGTELNRQGIAGVGLTRGEVVAEYLDTANGGLGYQMSAATMRTMCQHTERMPNEMLEIIWQPGPNDAESCIPVIGTGATPFLAGKNAIIGSVSGFPTGTGVRIRMINVVEWTPLAGNGLVSKVEPPRSANNINDVLMALPKLGGGENWFINAYKKARPYMEFAGSVINYGAKILGPAMMAL